MTGLAAVADEIERPAVRLFHDGADERTALLASIAVSLKRLADTLDGTALGVDISESLAALVFHQRRN